MAIKIIEPDKQINDDDSQCYIFDHGELMKLDPVDLIENEVLLLNFQSTNVWDTLGKMGFDTEQLREKQKEWKYHCPFETDMWFYGVYPYAIISDDISKYRVDEPFHWRSYDFMFDAQLTKETSLDFHTPCGSPYSLIDDSFKKHSPCQLYLSSSVKAFMGHGYTVGNLPYDGFGDLRQAKLPLNNGDFLIVITWVWYNR